MTKVSDFLPFSPQIPSARSFIRARGRRRVIVNHMVSIIAWIYFVRTSRRRQPIGNVCLSPLLRGGDRKFSFDPIPHEHVKKSKVFIALEEEKAPKWIENFYRSWVGASANDLTRRRGRHVKERLIKTLPLRAYKPRQRGHEEAANKRSWDRI